MLNFVICTITRGTPFTLTRSKDIVASSIWLIDPNHVGNIMDLVGPISTNINQVVGEPLLTMNTLEKMSQAIINDLNSLLLLLQ